MAPGSEPPVGVAPPRPCKVRLLRVICAAAAFPCENNKEATPQSTRKLATKYSERFILKAMSQIVFCFVYESFVFNSMTSIVSDGYMAVNTLMLKFSNKSQCR